MMANRPSPYWPRMMRRDLASLYLDISEAAFEREVASGRLPMPVKLGNRERWSRTALDEAIERIAGERGEDWRAQSPLYHGHAV